MPVEWDFPRAAKALVAAQQRCHDDGKVPSSSVEPSASKLVELDHWAYEESTTQHMIGGGGDGYLLHPPVLMPSKRLDRSSTPPFVCGVEEAEMADEKVVEEITVYDEPSSPIDVGGGSCEYTEWSFSVVFHATWRVPTLYFTCGNPDGTPLRRREVLDILLSRTSQQKNEQMAGRNDGGGWDEEELWEFVSQEEHPVTGQPAYFLHPCRTAERMDLLLSRRKDERRGDDGRCPLLSWMSMVLPVVGCRISPKVFCKMRKAMEGEHT